MSSYNNIQKIKYTKNPSDVVSLHEYIIFEDTHAKEKFVVFKFSNNVNQRLFELRFEVLQYNGDNELIEKSVVVHNNFVAGANELFVPNAKLKVNFECQSLEVRLETASFDRVVWSDGVFSDNSYRFDSYAETVTGSAQTLPASEEKKSHGKKQKQKKNKFGFNIRNISRRNRAVFPAVFNVILSVILIGLVVFSTFYFKNVTGAFSVGDFVVKESSTGYVTILGYAGSDENIEIPSTLDDKYSVTKIGEGAFRNSDVKNIVLNTQRSLVIETGAFNGCNALTVISAADGCGEVTVMESAFKNCKALNEFNVPTAKLCKKCFDGTHNVKTLKINSVVFTDGRLLDIFNGLESVTLNYSVKATYPASFYEGVR